MARGLFTTGFSVAEVLSIQQRAKEVLLEGKTIMNWNDADTSVGKQFAMPVAEVLDECAHALRLPRRSSARRAAGVPAGRGDRRPGSTETSPRPARSRPSPAGRRVTATRRSPDSPDCRSLRQETAGNGR